MPGTVIGSPTVHVIAIAKLRWDHFLVLRLESKARFDYGCIFEADLAADDVVELGTRVVTQRVEIADSFPRRIDFLKGLQQRCLTSLVWSHQNRLGLFDVKPATIANAPVLFNPCFL